MKMRTKIFPTLKKATKISLVDFYQIVEFFIFQLNSLYTPESLYCIQYRTKQYASNRNHGHKTIHKPNKNQFHEIFILRF